MTADTITKDTAFAAWQALVAARQNAHAKAAEDSQSFVNPNVGAGYVLGAQHGFDLAVAVLEELLK